MRAFRNIYLLALLPAMLKAGLSSDVGSPQKRMVTVDLARTLLTTKQPEGGPDYIARNDPFNPPGPVAAVSAEKVSPSQGLQMADRDLLVNLSAQITPSGTIKVGDTQILLFGQKKLKVGDSISIVFQGATYDLQVSGIERASYTLRLNQEEITRPIKPVTKL